MTHRRFVLAGLIAIALLANRAPADPSPFTEHCDGLGQAVKDLPSDSPTSCQAACRQIPDCEGFTFISGWGRCFLRKKITKQVKIKMTSGEAGGPLTADHDYTGKDLKQANAATPEACAERCREQAGCLAFTFIDGYSTCWLKKSKGRLLPKVFTCGTR